MIGYTVESAVGLIEALRHAADPRTPKKGDFYLAATGRVSLATRNLKKPRHIMQECS